MLKLHRNPFYIENQENIFFLNKCHIKLHLNKISSRLILTYLSISTHYKTIEISWYIFILLKNEKNKIKKW